MKRLLLLLVLVWQSACAGIWVAPEFVGNGENDSVIVSFCTFDTTYYPTINNADSVIALRYGPDNDLVDSLTQSSSVLYNIRTGWYEVHYRGANGDADEGIYRVYVRVKVGGAWRGAASVSYRVIADEIGDYLTRLLADGDSIKDTLSLLQHAGDPVPVDSEQVARAVWDDDVIGRAVRRIGWVDTADVVNNIPSSGSGAYACSLLVVESSEQAPVQGVFLRVMNSSESATAAIGVTDSEGRALFSLDAAEYHLFPYLSGYLFEQLPETVTVTTEGVNDTIGCTRFDPGAPQSPELCRVYGYVHSLGAQGLEGVSVSASILTAPLLYDGVIISPYRVSTATDSTGYWYLDVIPNEQLSPVGTVYDFTIYNEAGTVLRKQLAVPDSSSFHLKW